MKKILLLTIVALTVGVGQLFSQSKVGHVEYEYLIYLMPEIKDVEKKVLDKQQQFQNYLQEKEKLLATLQAEIQDQTKDELIRQQKYNQFEKERAEAQQFAQEAEVRLARERETLLKPVLDRLDAGIKEVATEKGYDYVLSKTASQGYIVLFSKNEADDLTKAVIEKLDLKVPEEDTTSPATNSLLVQPK